MKGKYLVWKNGKAAKLLTIQLVYIFVDTVHIFRMALLAGWEELCGFLHLMDEEGGRVLGCHAHVLQDVDVLAHVHVHVHKDHLLTIVAAHVSQLKLHGCVRQSLAWIS
jgi:hypothetical protein